jgi:hypothetical protein
MEENRFMGASFANNAPQIQCKSQP